MVHRSGSGCFSPATSPENGNKMTLKGAESDCLTMANESDLLDQKSNKDAYYAVDSDESFIPVGQTHPNQNLTKDKTIEINYTNIVKDESTKQCEESTSSNTFLESLSLTHKQSKPYMKMNSNSLESSGKPNNKNNTNISVNNMGECCLPEESDNKKCNDDKNIVEFKNSVNSFKNTCVESNIVADTDASEMNLRSNEHCAPNVVENQSVRLKEISLPCKLPLAKLTDILDQISPKRLNATSNTSEILASDACLRNSYVDVRDCLSNNLKMCPLGNVKSDIKILVNNERIVNTNNDNLDSISLKNKTVMLNSLEIRPRILDATPINSKTNLTSSTVKKSVSNRILCLYCDKTFATATLQNKHSEKVHLVASNRRSSGRNASTQNDICFQGCSFCPNGKGKSQIVAVTTDLSDLFKHLVSFHKESYFACGACIVRFTSLDFLNTHMSEVHGEIVEALKLEDNKSDKVEIMLESQSPVPSSFKRCKNSKLKIKSLEIAASSTPTDTTDTPESEIDFEDSISVNIISSKADDSSELASKPGTKEAKPAASKVPLKMTRSQSSLQASNADEPMLSRLGVAQNRSPRTRKISKTRKADVKVQSIDRKNKSKNDIQEFVINKNINSKNELFDSKFDVDFYQQVIVNVRDNLAHHLDGKLNGSRSNGRLSCPLSPPVKSNMAEITRDGEIHESNLSLKTISAFPTLLTFEQYGSNLSSGSASKITRKKATKNSWKWKWDFIKKYKYYNENGKIVKKIKPSNLGQRDLSKLDMWTQLSMRTKHDSIARKASKKSSYEVSEKNKKLRQLKSLNEILDMRLFPKLNLEQDAQDIKAGVKNIVEVKEETAATTTEYSISDTATEMNKTRHISFEDTNSESDVQPVRISSRRKSVRIQSTTNSGSLNSSASASNVKNLQLKPISMPDTIENSTPSILGDQTISSITKTEQATSTVESISENKDIPSCLNLIPRKAEEANSSQVDPILSGEWVRPRCYICMCCGAKLLTSKQLEDHKTSQHPYIYSTHYEIVGNEMIDNELYKLFYLPGMNTGKYVSDLKKDRSTDLSVKCIKNIENRVKTESEVKSCTKCGKELSNSSELYRHILECAGDYTWLLAKKKCKYRPFGRRSRRKKTRLPNVQIPRRRPTNVKPIRRTIKKDSGPRSKPSDAETIQRMLSNLPAKRSSRHIAPIPRPRNRPVSKTHPLIPTTIRRAKNREVTTQRITRNLIQNKQLTQKQQNSKDSSKKAAEDGTKIIRNVANSNKFKNKTIELPKVSQGQIIKLGRRTIIKEDDTPIKEDLQTKQVTNKTKRVLKTTRIISSKIIDTTKVGVRRKMTRGRIIKPIPKEDDNNEEKDSKDIEANTDNVTVVPKKILKPSRKETITKSLVKTLSFRKKNDKSKSSTEKKVSELPIDDENSEKINTPVLKKINRKTRNVISKVARTLRNKKSKRNEMIVENNTNDELETTKNIDSIEKHVESVASNNTQTEKCRKTSRKAKLIKNKKKVKTNVEKANDMNEKVESVVTKVCANNAQKDESIQKDFQKDEAIENDKLLIDAEKIVDATEINILPENTSRTVKRNTNAINKAKLIENVTSQSDAILNDDVISGKNTLHTEASVTKAFLTYVKSVKGNRKTKLNKRNISKELKNIADHMTVTKCKDIKQNGSIDLVTHTEMEDVKLIVELKPKTEDDQLKYPVADIRNVDIPSSDACNMTTSNEKCISEIISVNIKDQAKINAKSPKKSPKRKDIKSKLVRKLSIRRTKKYDLQKQMEKDGKKEEVDTIKLIEENNPEVSIDIPIEIKQTDKVVPKKKQSKLKSLKTVIDVLKGDKKKRVSPKYKNKTVVIKPPILKIPVLDKIMSAHALVNKIETVEDKIVKGHSITSDNDITHGNIDFTKVIISSENILNVSKIPKIVPNSENVVNHNVESIIPKREILNIPLFVKSGVNSSLTNSENVAETNTTTVGHNKFQKNIDKNSIVSFSITEVGETNISDPVNLSSETKLQEPLLNIPKPVLKSPSITKRPGKKLDDCIAMLTGKLQAKLSEKAKAISPVNSIFNSLDLSVCSNSSITNIFTDSKNTVSPAICNSEKLSEVKDQLTQKSEEKEVLIEKDNIWLNCHADKSIQNTDVIQKDISLSVVDHIESVIEKSKIFEESAREVSLSQENNYPLMINTEISIVEPFKCDSYEHDTIPTLLPYAETIIEDYMENQSTKLEENNSFVDKIVLPLVSNSEPLREDSLVEIISDSDILRRSISDLKVASNQLKNVLFEDISVDVDDMKQAMEQPITNTCEYPTEELVQQVIDEVLVESMNLSEDSDSQLHNILPSLNDIEDIVNNEITENAVKVSLSRSSVIDDNSTIENLSNENIEKINNLGDEIISASISERPSLTDKSDTFDSLQQCQVSIENNLESVTTVDSNFINFENKIANNVEKQQCIVNISLDKVGDMIQKLKLLKNKINTKTYSNDNQKIEVNKEKNIRFKKGKRKIKKNRKKQLRPCIFTNDILNTAITEETAEVDELNTAFIKIQNKKILSRVKKNKTPRTGERRSLRNEILMHAVNNNIKLLTEEKVIQAEPIQEICYPINNMNDKNLNILSADEAPEMPLDASLETNTSLEKFLCNELSLNDVMNKENVLSLLDIPNLETSELKSPVLNSIVEVSTVIQESLLDFSSNNEKSCLDDAILQTPSNDIFAKELSMDINSATKTCVEEYPKCEDIKIVTENLQNEARSINKPIIVDMIKKSDNGIDNVFDKILIEHHNSVTVTPSNGSEIGIVVDVDNEKSIIPNICEPNLKSNLNNKDDKILDTDTSFVSDNENINKYSENNQNKVITHENEDEPICLETKELELLEKPQLKLRDKSNDLSDSDEDISLAVVAKKLSKLVNEHVVHDDAEVNQISNKTIEMDEVACSEEDIMEKPETIVTFELIKTKKKRRYRKSILLNYKKNKPSKVESTLIPINTVETSPSKTENYCDICNKLFTRPESLSKHKMTLTHIAKLSEIEAREFFNNRKLENDDTIEAEQPGITNLNLERVAEELHTLSNEIPSQNIICIEDDSLICKSNEEDLSLRHTNDKEVIDLDTSSTDSHSLIIEIDNAIAQDEYTTTKSINNDNYSISIPATIDDEDEASIMQTTNTYNPQSPKISCKNDLTDIANRKTLSVEEALFFECCSLLKSSETTKQEGEINTFHKNIFSAVSAVTEPASSKMHLDLNQFSDISSDSNHTHQQAIPHPPPSRIYQDDSCSSNLTAFLASVDKFINAPVANQTSKSEYDSITDNHQNMNYSPISNNEQNDPKSMPIFNQNRSPTHFSTISSNNESKSPFFHGNVIFNHHKSTASILNQITTNYSPISNHSDLDTPNNSSNIYSNVSISVQHEKNNHVFYSSNVGPMYNQTTSINLIEARTKNVYSEEALIVRTYSDTFSDMGDSYPSSQDASDRENYLQTIKDRLTIRDNVDDTTNRFAVVKNVLSEEANKVQSNNFTNIHDLDRTSPIPKDIEDSSNNYFASQSPVLYNSPEQSHSSSKKFLTKGALKVFESVKVSIPTAEIDLDRIIVNTNETARSKLAAFVEIALQDRENMRARSENIVETPFIECTEPLSSEVVPEPSITSHMKGEVNTQIVEDIGGNEDCLIIDEDICSDKDDSLMSEKCDFTEANFKVTTRIENNKNILIINKTTKPCEQNMNKVKIKDLEHDLKETKVKNAKFGNSLGFKIKKKRSATKKINKKSPKEKKVNTKFKTPKKNIKQTDKMNLALKDIYEFEDSQDVCELDLPTVSPINTSLGYLSHNVPIQTKSDVDTLSSTKNIIEPANVVVQNDDSQISSLSFSDRDDFTYISDNFSNPSDSEATQNTKLSINKTENNPKCVIMGRIFKNAVKDKIDKPEKQNLDQLFDSLRTEKVESQTLTNDIPEQDQTLVNTSCSNAEQSTEFTIVTTEQIPKVKNTKKVQLSKEKTKNMNSTREEKQAPSDLERNISPTKKKRKSRDKLTTENETDGKSEYTEDIGVAHRKSQRKCTTGKQNVLVEFWSSDEEFDLVRKKDSKLKSEKRIGKAEKSLKMNSNLANSKGINHMENEQPEVNKSHIPTTKLMQEENMNTNIFSDSIKPDQEKLQESSFETISNIGDEDIILQDLKNLLCNEPNSEVILQEALLDTEDNIIQTNKQISALQKATRKRRKSRRKSIRLDADLDVDVGVLAEKEVLPESIKLSDIVKEAINPKEIITENKYEDSQMEQKPISDVHKINTVSVDYLSSTVLDAVDKAINIEDRTAVSENKTAPEKCAKRESIIESHLTDDIILNNIADIIYNEILPQADLSDVTSLQPVKEPNENISILKAKESLSKSTIVDEVLDVLDDTFVQGKQKEKCTVPKKMSNQSSSELKNGIDPEVDVPKKHKRRRKRANQSLKYVESSSESDLEKEIVTPRARIKKRRQTICFTELNEITDNCEDDVRHQSDIESRGVKFTNDQNKRKLKDKPSLHYSRQSENLTDESKSHHNKKQNDSKCKKPKQRRRRQDVNDDAVTAAILSEPRRKRIASEMLYYWSSSSDDDQYAGMIEVKPIRDDVVNPGEQPIQHGWIVGDSHKKLVTLLAHTKGKKTEDCVVKEGSGKRSRHTM